MKRYTYFIFKLNYWIIPIGNTNLYSYHFKNKNHLELTKDIKQILNIIYLNHTTLHQMLSLHGNYIKTHHVSYQKLIKHLKDYTTIRLDYLLKDTHVHDVFDLITLLQKLDKLDVIDILGEFQVPQSYFELCNHDIKPNLVAYDEFGLNNVFDFNNYSQHNLKVVHNNLKKCFISRIRLAILSLKQSNQNIFSATFIRFGKSPISKRPTILLRNIKYKNQLIAKHLWIQNIDKLYHLSKKQTIYFKGTIYQYWKQKQNMLMINDGLKDFKLLKE